MCMPQGFKTCSSTVLVSCLGLFCFKEPAGVDISIPWLPAYTTFFSCTNLLTYIYWQQNMYLIVKVTSNLWIKINIKLNYLIETSPADNCRRKKMCHFMYCHSHLQLCIRYNNTHRTISSVIAIVRWTFSYH